MLGYERISRAIPDLHSLNCCRTKGSNKEREEGKVREDQRKQRKEKKKENKRKPTKLSTHTRPLYKTSKYISMKKSFVTKSSIVPVSQCVRFPTEIKSYILASNCVRLHPDHWTILISLFFTPQILPASISVGTSLLRPHRTFFAFHNVIYQKCSPTDSQRTAYVPIASELYHTFTLFNHLLKALITLFCFTCL